MPDADWLIGSYPNLEAQSLSITASASTTAHELPAGDYYLYDDHSAFDLLDTLGETIELHAAILPGDISVSLLYNRHVRIFSSGVAFALTWPADNILRNLLGFTGNLVSANTHTAANVSPLFWSAGKRGTYEARLGTNGIPVRDIARGQAGTGTMRSNSFNRYRRNTVSFRYVQNARVWTEDEAGGEFVSFFDNVLVESRPFKIYRGVPEDVFSNDSADPAGDGEGVLPSGTPANEVAYVYTGPTEFPYGREFGFTETLHPVSIPVASCREFDA